MPVTLVLLYDARLLPIKMPRTARVDAFVEARARSVDGMTRYAVRAHRARVLSAIIMRVTR